MEESRVSVAGANLNVLLVFYPLENRGNEELWCAWNHYAPRTARPLACLTKLSPVRSGSLKDVYFLCPNASKLKTSITQVLCNKLFANLASSSPSGKYWPLARLFSSQTFCCARKYMRYFNAVLILLLYYFQIT